MKTYEPAAVPLDNESLDPDLENIIDKIAFAVHERWAQGRLNDGWKYGETRDDNKKEHPCLIPYDDLSEQERDYDRNTARTTIKLLQHFGYVIQKQT